MTLDSSIIKTEQFNQLEREVWYWKRVAAELASSLNEIASLLDKAIIENCGEDFAWPTVPTCCELTIPAIAIFPIREEANSVLHALSEASWNLNQKEADDEIAGYLPTESYIAAKIQECEIENCALHEEACQQFIKQLEHG